MSSSSTSSQSVGATPSLPSSQEPVFISFSHHLDSISKESVEILQTMGTTCKKIWNNHIYQIVVLYPLHGIVLAISCLFLSLSAQSCYRSFLLPLANLATIPLRYGFVILPIAFCIAFFSKDKDRLVTNLKNQWSSLFPQS